MTNQRRRSRRLLTWQTATAMGWFGLLTVAAFGCANRAVPAAAAAPSHAEKPAAKSAAKSTAKSAAKSAASAKSHASGEDHGATDNSWCNEHRVPERACTKCQPKLIDAFKKSGDWCDEHGFPESVCPVCNPQQPPIGGEMGAVLMTAEAANRSGIRTVRGRRGPLVGRIELPAEVHFNPNRLAHVRVIVAGELVAVKVLQGDTVKAGQVIAVVRSAEVGRARAAQAKAKAQLSAARQALARQRRLRASGINAGRDLIAAKLAVASHRADVSAANAELAVHGVTAGVGSTMTIRAPFDGIVVARHAVLGEFVTPRDRLFKIADLSQVWVLGKAYERHLARVTVGAVATVQLDAYAGRLWPGTVSFVSPTVDARTRTVDVRVVLDNPTGELRPGLFGTLVLQPVMLQPGAKTGGSMSVGVIIPAAAVQPHGDQHIVFLPGDQTGVYSARVVKVLRRAGGEVEVLGLKAADGVIGPGAFILKSELVKGNLADSCGGH